MNMETAASLLGYGAMASDTPGIRYTTREQYDALVAVNWSTLRYAELSAAHLQAALAVSRPETDAMRLGRATHTAVFEPDRLLLEYVVWEGGTRRGKEWDAFRELHEGKTILLPDDYARALAIRDAVHTHPVAAPLLEHGQAEMTITWTDKDTGLPCKARMDWLDGADLTDLKTTRCVEARQFGRHAADLRYHCQLAFYATGLEANGMEPTVRIIAVENEPPYDVAVYTLGPDELWPGEVAVRKALDLVAHCRKTGEWPGRYSYEQPLQLPNWEYPDTEEAALVYERSGRA
jgi:hypothetical protein